MFFFLLDCFSIGSCCKCNKDFIRFYKIWLCEKKYMICCWCFVDKMFYDNKMRCLFCLESLELIKFLCEDNDYVFIYVDDFNMWIEVKKLVVNKLNLKCVEDLRFCLDIGKVMDVVVNNRKVVWGILYGLEFLLIDFVW